MEKADENEQASAKPDRGAVQLLGLVTCHAAGAVLPDRGPISSPPGVPLLLRQG